MLELVDAVGCFLGLVPLFDGRLDVRQDCFQFAQPGQVLLNGLGLSHQSLGLLPALMQPQPFDL